MQSRITARRLALLGATILATHSLPAFAQSQQPSGQGDQTAQVTSGDDEEIVVTGFRASLQSSTNAKRNSVGFTDSIF